MKSKNMMKNLAALALLITVFAGKSHAGYYQLPAGSFTVMTHATGSCQNPNGFPVVTVWASQLANSLAGFLLDGSESSSHWLKVLQEADQAGRSLVIYTDDNWSHAYCGQITENGTTGGAYKILALAIGP